jgi:transcriptional/translational regulatory protein YebC/TACO1
MAAREGGGDPEANFRLRLAVERARNQNMPKENSNALSNVAQARVKKQHFEEVMYEGYAPNGVALMIECVTENRNRTVAEIRHILTRSGGTWERPVRWAGSSTGGLFLLTGQGKISIRSLSWQSRVARTT